MGSHWGTWLGCVLLVATSVPGFGQEAEEDDLRSGLVGHYTGRSGGAFQQIDMSLALSWDTTTEDHRLAGGPRGVRWSGYLMSQAPGTYQLHAYLRGEVVIRWGEKEILRASRDTLGWVSSTPLELPFDYHPLEIEYTARLEPSVERVERTTRPNASSQLPSTQLPSTQPSASQPDSTPPSQAGSDNNSAFSPQSDSPAGAQLASATNRPTDLQAGAAREAFRFSLFWTGPQFSLEPIGPNFLFHDHSRAPSRVALDAALAGDLTRALRCAACHLVPGESESLAGPALDRLAGNVHPAWLTAWLLDANTDLVPVDQATATNRITGGDDSVPAAVESSPAGEAAHETKQGTRAVDGRLRRMPHFGLTEADARAISAFLLHAASTTNREPAVGPSAPSSQTSATPAPTGPVASAPDGRSQQQNVKGSAPPAKPTSSQPVSPPQPKRTNAQVDSSSAKRGGNQPVKEEPIDLQAGERLLLTVGCLACHQYQGLGRSDLFTGGDLTRIAAKRPADFFAAWLEDPTHFNRDSRMPVFDLSNRERRNLAAVLSQLAVPGESPRSHVTASERPIEAPHKKRGGDPTAKVTEGTETAEELAKLVQAGAELVQQHRCVACHRMPQALTRQQPLQPLKRESLAKAITDAVGCFGTADPRQHRPGYELADEQRAALARYLIGQLETEGSPETQQPTGIGSEPGGADQAGRNRSETTPDRSFHPPSEQPGRGPSTAIQASSEPPRTIPNRSDRVISNQPPLSKQTKLAEPATRGADHATGDNATSEVIAARVRRAGTPLVLGRRELLEQNCLACHARTGEPGLAETAAQIVAAHAELAAELPAMTPPALDSVGDKLLDDALQAAILRRDPPRRPYLLVRMPRFHLTEPELQALVNFFVTQDRVPDFDLVKATSARVEPPRPGTDPALPPARDPAGIQAPSDPAQAGSSQTASTQPTPPQQPIVSAAKDAQSAEPVTGDSKTVDARHAATGLALLAAGSRLVTTDGFGCTSCHAIADVEPVKAPLNARGPNLSMLGQRIRRSWFDRFVANPARLVPRMEMPSVRIPVRGLLEEDLQRQLSAVWDILNQEGFRPPLPDPVRVVRRSGIASAAEPAVVITDVIRERNQVYIKPLLIGLSNRHNLLFDLATARLTQWSIGDLARQRTEGKTWFWELAGTPLWQVLGDEPELRVQGTNQILVPQLQGQFLTEFDTIVSTGDQLRFTYRLQLDSPREPLQIEQRLQPRAYPDQATEKTGFRRELTVRNLLPGERVQLRIPTANQANPIAAATAAGEVSWNDNTGVRVLEPAEVESIESGWWSFTAEGNELLIKLEYDTEIPVDHFPQLDHPFPSPQVERLAVVPGFESFRLPLPEEVMPTALAWRPNGELVIASLKGQIWLGRDQDGDGLHEAYRAFSDDLAAPYGLAITGSQIDVVNKYAVLRLTDEDEDGRADRYETVASGWGHTADYHDWAVGLPRDGAGGYYVALPCQQDQRSEAAARFRGQILQLHPRQPDRHDPRRYRLETVTQGHRFPMGLARNRAGQLFVTDNQGNYNPFNELNHVVRGKHYGFINTLERRPDYRPTLTPPAIDLPHPWTRSVNGICFLETPDAVLTATGQRRFGPFEGHLLGCEYDTRRLIRMSLQQVGDIMQGACYPFTVESPATGSPLLGPLTCEVAPNGDLYIGSIRDSGWGGANNIGELVRMRLEPDRLPCGIAEVRTYGDGLEITLTKPADLRIAADVDNYSVASYTRTSTPAYGGPDQQRRVERIESIVVEDQGQRIRLRLSEKRTNFVYEVRLKNIAPQGAEFFPSEAYITCRGWEQK